MKQLTLALALLCLMSVCVLAQEAHPQSDPFCSTPNLDSAAAVSLPHYNNNEILSSYLIQKGYYNLEQISLPNGGGNAKTEESTFLEPIYLIPIHYLSSQL